MKENTIVYFGTTFKGSGHGATVIKGGFDDFQEQGRIERNLDLIDSFKEVRHSIRNSPDKFGVFHFREGTAALYLLSPHDHRGGSKTMAFAFGQQLDEAQMIDIIKNSPFLKRAFTEVCKVYNLKNLFE